MKIGDRVFVRGYIDEIRKDTVIVRNDGGYFGTIPSEVITGELPSAQPERKKGKWKTAYLPHEYMGCRPMAYYCSECNHITTFRTAYCPNCGADMRTSE